MLLAVGWAAGAEDWGAKGLPGLGLSLRFAHSGHVEHCEHCGPLLCDTEGPWETRSDVFASV